MTGMGHPELVVKAAEQHGAIVVSCMLENAEQLFIQRIFFDAVMIVKSRLSAPANVESAGNVGLAPLHYLAQLFPVFNLLELHLLNGRARDDQSVKLSVLDLVEGLVKRQHVLGGGVL